MFRRTGQTTSLAFYVLYKCYNNINTPVEVRDHFGTREANRNLMRQIRTIVKNMDLKGFVFNDVKNTVMLKMRLQSNLEHPEVFLGVFED